MKTIKYSEIPYLNLDAAMFIANECADSEDSKVGFDLGDNQIALFEIKDLGDHYHLTESLDDSGDVYVDENTEGEYDTNTLVELLVSRLNSLDEITDYPRISGGKKEAISKAKAVLS